MAGGLSWCILFITVNFKMNSQSAQIIKMVNQKLPSGNTPADQEKVNTYWPLFDKNKNGYLSLAQIDQGVRFVIKLPDLFPLGPVVKRAFNASKARLKAMTKYGDDFVSKGEFPYLLRYIKNYYIYWALFNEIDKNHDKKISLCEFNDAIPLFKANKIPVPNVKQLFDEVDKNKGGFIEFDQFCHWVLLNRIEFHL